MADWSNDIEKYRKGELSPSQRHALEKKALSDPFLADALDGADQISEEDFSNDIKELNRKITATRKKTLWTPLRVAAGIFLIVGVSSVLYFLSIEPSVEKLAEQIQPDEASQVPKTSEQKDSLSKPNDNLITLNEPHKKEEQDVTASEQQPVAEIESPELKQDDKPSASDPLLLAEEKNADDERKTEAEIVPAPVLKEDAKIADAQVARSLAEEPTDEKKKSIARNRELNTAKKLSAPSQSGAYRSQNSQQVVTGRVTSAEDGSPLPGVNVVVKGTTEGAITDADGNYSIPLTNQHSSQLVFSFIGLESAEADVKDQSPLNVQMNTDVRQLSEVVVTGYGLASGDTGEPSSHTYNLAEPAGGKRAYRKYLETNLRYPPEAKEKKIEGKVTVEFTVKTNGALSDFRVVKGIGSGCDEEVIRLVQEGPEWTASKQDEKIVDSQMRITLRFKLPDNR